MSEEILRALMQLFALITKQDGGVGDKEIAYVERFLVQQIGVDAAGEYLDLYVRTAEDPGTAEKGSGDAAEPGTKKPAKLTSVLDSVKVLKLCKQISKTINQRQKVVVLVRILELVNAEYNLTEQRLGIVRTVADIFRISGDEYGDIFAFVTAKNEDALRSSGHLVVSGQWKPPDDLPLTPEDHSSKARHYHFRGLDATLLFLRIASVELYFMRYSGEQECLLNGLAVKQDVIYIFASGSSLRFPVGPPILYSDIASQFQEGESTDRLILEASDISYYFPGGVTGLDKVSFSAHQGNLVGILGSSGSGKTTLMNVLSGMYRPSGGRVTLNGRDVHSDPDGLAGISGFVPQDDLLIEELSVFDNLYYNARLCFRHLSRGEIREKVTDTLKLLGLFDKRHLKVGSVMNKTISGGQRKRLNIALELIREPAVLFLDEPTSGLSSRDSENVMDLLRELSLKGKLVFVVIHQPSSDIFKMFDRVVILDEGGRMVWFGNPVESVIHFKTADNQVNAGVGECPVCGNVNPELIFNIIESRKVDEYGNYTGERRVSPETWEQLYQERLQSHAPHTLHAREPQRESGTSPPAGKSPSTGASPSKASGPSTGPASPADNQPPGDPPPIPASGLKVPGWFSQLSTYFSRDAKTKLNNTQYLLLTLLVSPVLALILALIVRYKADPESDLYIFRENENIPIFIFMALIVALFLGLIVSAEEIFKDRRILRREKFLNLSRSSYLMSKIGILVSISAIQALAFVLIANGILEIRQMTAAYWLALFSISVCANLIGLVISSAFNSAVTIYIVIPLIMIPMMVLSGAMFTFDKLNRKIAMVDKVPLIAELMPTKWSYEALMVHQFKANEFEKHFYDYEKRISIHNFKSAYLIPELEERLNQCVLEFRNTRTIEESTPALEVLRNEIDRVDHLVKDISFSDKELTPDAFSESTILKASRFLRLLKRHHIERYSVASREKERHLARLMQDRRDVYFSMLNKYHNESVADHVKKIYEKNPIIEYHGRLYQRIDPVFMDPDPEGFMGFRSHFFAPRKYFMGRYFNTFHFNIAFIWALTLICYIILYFDLLGRLLNNSPGRRKSKRRQAS